MGQGSNETRQKINDLSAEIFEKSSLLIPSKRAEIRGELQKLIDTHKINLDKLKERQPNGIILGSYDFIIIDMETSLELLKAKVDKYLESPFNLLEYGENYVKVLRAYIEERNKKYVPFSNGIDKIITLLNEVSKEIEKISPHFLQEILKLTFSALHLETKGLYNIENKYRENFDEKIANRLIQWFSVFFEDKIENLSPEIVNSFYLLELEKNKKGNSFYILLLSQLVDTLDIKQNKEK